MNGCSTSVAADVLVPGDLALLVHRLELHDEDVALHRRPDDVAQLAATGLAAVGHRGPYL